MALAVGIAQAVDQLAEQRVIVAQPQRRIVEETAGIDVGRVDLCLDVLRGEPLLERRVLRAAGEVAGARGLLRRGGRGRWRRADRCLLERVEFARHGSQPLDQFFHEEHGAIDGARRAAAPAGGLGVDGRLRVFADEAAFVAAVDGHAGAFFLLSYPWRCASPTAHEPAQPQARQPRKGRPAALAASPSRSA